MLQSVWLFFLRSPPRSPTALRLSYGVATEAIFDGPLVAPEESRLSTM